MPVLLDPQLIEDEATRAPIGEVAAALQRALGQKPVAYLAGISDAKLVGQWARGKVTPRADAQTRMREAYKAVAMIRSAYGDGTARAWLFGCNSRLDDHAPAWVLRHASDPEDFELVVPTARAFAAGGA